MLPLAGIIALSMFFAGLFILLAIVTPAAEMREREETGSEPEGFFDSYIKPTLRSFLPQSQLQASLKGSERGKIEALLDRSGNPWGINVSEYKSMQMLFAVVAFAVGLLVWFLSLVPFLPGWITTLAFLYMGYVAPESLLKAAAKKRLAEYDVGLPEFMDLLVINMKAGRNLESAIGNTVEKMPSGPLRAALKRSYSSIRAGAPMRATLEDMAVKSGSEDMHAFVKSIVLSQQSGGDPSEGVAHQAEVMRDQRMYRLNKKASSLSSYLVMVLIVTMLPALMILAGGPALVRLMDFL